MTPPFVLFVTGAFFCRKSDWFRPCIVISYGRLVGFGHDDFVFISRGFFVAAAGFRTVLIGLVSLNVIAVNAFRLDRCVYFRNIFYGLSFTRRVIYDCFQVIEGGW